MQYGWPHILSKNPGESTVWREDTWKRGCDIANRFFLLPTGTGITPLADTPIVPILGLAAVAETEVATETEAAGDIITGGNERRGLGTTRGAAAGATLGAGRGGMDVAGVIREAGRGGGARGTAGVRHGAGEGRDAAEVTRERGRGGGGEGGVRSRTEGRGAEVTHKAGRERCVVVGVTAGVSRKAKRGYRSRQGLVEAGVLPKLWMRGRRRMLKAGIKRSAMQRGILALILAPGVALSDLLERGSVPGITHHLVLVLVLEAGANLRLRKAMSQQE